MNFWTKTLLHFRPCATAKKIREPLVPLLLLLFTLLSQMAIGQTKFTVKGKVTGENGATLAGVSVLEKNTSNGVTTGTDGTFSIDVSKQNAILTVSFVGYETADVAVGNRLNINITLNPEATSLTDVVVIGYGKQKKTEVTSAVASVKQEDFTKGFARDAGQLIQGKVAGLAISTSSGDPNATTQISLRGNSTITSSTQPLILIDGIPGAINSVAPEDIESVDVLKDGSAAAIYGTRGTNGVILITTKKRNGNRPATLTYDGYVSVQSIARKMEFLDAADYRRLIADGFFPSNQKYDYGTSTDWLGEITRTPVSQTHNLTLQGGNGQTNYVASMNYRHWEGLFLRSNNQQFTGRLEANHSMLDGKLKFNVGVISRNRKYFSGPNYSYIYRQAIIRNPTDSVYDYMGRWKEDPNGYNYDNPVRPIEEVEGESKMQETRLNGSVVFSPIRDLNFKLLVSNVKENWLTGYAESFDHRASVINGRRGYASRSTSLRDDRLLEFTTDYSKSFGLHKATVLGGYSYQDVTNESFEAWNSHFPTELFTYNELGVGDAYKQVNIPGIPARPYGMESGKNNFRLIGFFARVNYTFNEKYMLLASVRREGSTKFGENYKNATFPAVSAGWRLSKESFMQNVTFIDDLKFRVGFGVTGTAPNNNYDGLISYAYQTSRFLSNGQWVQPLVPTRNPNPNLRWEKKSEYNAGLDFAMFRNKLSGSIDVYQRTTNDLLYDLPVATPPNLVGTTRANAGTMKNKGVEVLLNYNFINTKDVGLDANVTYSFNKNELVSINSELASSTVTFFNAGHTGEPIQLATHRIEVGQPVGNFFGYKSVDIDENGKWIIEGADGKPKPLASANDQDRKVLGNGLPKHTAAMNVSFRYKRFDMALNMRGAFGYQILNFQRLYYENPTIKQYNMLKTALDPVYGKTMLNNPLTYVSYYIENGDHWKFDNITLGYNIPVANSKYFKNARVYVSGLNMLVLTGYKGIDPELSRGGLDAGNDSRDKYPTTRTYTFGVNFTL